MYDNRVIYRLDNEFDEGIELEYDPIGWNEDEREMTRSMKSLSVFTTLSNDLEFVKDGAKYITDTFDRFGTETKLTLTRLIKHPQTDVFEVDYIGNLDLKTFDSENNKVKIKFLTGGLKSVIDSQKREKFELSRETTIEGEAIPPIEYSQMLFNGRNLLLSGELRTDERFRFGAAGLFVLPNALLQTDDQNLVSVIPTNPNDIQNTFENGDVNTLNWQDTEIFYKPVRERTTLRLNIAFSELALEFGNGGINRFGFVLCKISDNDFNNVYDSDEQFELINYNPQDNEDIQVIDGIEYNVTSVASSIEVTLEEGQGLAYYSFRSTAALNVLLRPDCFTINVEQDSAFDTTINKGLRIFKAFQRLSQIYTGRDDRFISEYFGNREDGYQNNGEFSDALLSSGLMIRNFDDATLRLSFDDAIGLNNYFNIGWSVETFGRVEKLVVENLQYYFNSFIALDLSDEDVEIKRSSASDLLYSSMTFGNDKAGDYEELQGLSEYNAKTTYTSTLLSADSKYDVDGKIRADIIGAELARRKQFETSPTEDTPYDKEIFLLDTKNEESNFYFRRWFEDYEAISGIYDPDTAFNLRLTPFRSLERHAWLFNSGCTRYQDKFTRYANGTGKVDISTKKVNEPVRFENGDIVNSELPRSKFRAEYIEFEYPLTFEVSKQLRGKTNVNGRMIPNTNGLIKIKSKGDIIYGWLMSLKFNDGVFKLIRANT